MAGFYDSASNDFNTAINNYKNNVGSVAQSMIQGDISQVSNAKDLLMEKAGILAGGEESTISDKIQAGMSKTMDELGLDMSVHAIGEKILPWAAKKLKGKFKNMREDREQARKANSEQTRDNVPASEDANRQDILDNMSNRADLNNDTSELPRGGEQNRGAGARDNEVEQPNTGAREINPATGEEIDRNARVQQNEDQMPEDVLDEDGNPMEEEGARVQRQGEDQAIDDADRGGGLNRFGGRGEVGSGGRQAIADSKAAQARVDTGAPAEGASAGESSVLPDVGDIGAGTATKSSSIQEEFARRQGRGTGFTAEEEESLRGSFNPAVRQTLESRGNVSGGAGPAPRPDPDVEGIPAQAPPVRAPPRTMTAEDYQAARESGTTGRISVSQRRPQTAEQRQAGLDDQAQIQREQQAGARPAGQTDRSMQDEDIGRYRPPVQDQTWSGGTADPSVRPLDLANEEQLTSSGALRDLQAQAATESRNITSTVGDYEATFGEKAAGAAGDLFGFLGDVLGPAAAIFGGVEAAKGIHDDIKDSLDPNNDPFAQVQKLIGSAQGQQAGMDAAISADQFSSKVGAGRPSFGSLAAPTFDSSSIMQSMGGHF